MSLPETMQAVRLPGNSTVEHVELPVPTPGPGQVLTLHGSGVTSTLHLERLLEHLVRHDLHPDVVVSDRLPLAEAARADELADAATTGKVCIVF